MKQSELFAKLKRESPKDAETISHKYLVRGDFISQSFSGVYRFLPLGKKVLENIKKIVRSEMIGLGAQEVELPALQNKSLWLKTGRWQTIDPPLFKFRDRHKKEIALGSTHEEDITDLFGGNIKTPTALFQIQTKFRNEMRPTGGLLRTREFLMKDLYSFHSEEKDFSLFYEEVKKSYFRIFKRCGLIPVCVEADPGTIGGNYSHEFLVVSSAGEDTVNGDKAIEVGHIFSLGTKYSQAMNLSRPVIMGCYGIGISRLMGVIVEANHDEKGIIWPKEVAPFQVHLLNLGQKKESDKLHQDLQEAGVEVLYDDRDKSAGEKFAEADLIGIPTRLIVSEKTLKKDSVEIKKRGEQKTRLVRISGFPKSPLILGDFGNL